MMSNEERHNSRINVFFKCRSMIHTCVTESQLDVAKIYCELFLRNIVEKDTLHDRILYKFMEGFLSGMIHERLVYIENPHLPLVNVMKCDDRPAYEKLGISLRSLLDGELGNINIALIRTNYQYRCQWIGMIEKRIKNSDWIAMSDGTTYSKTFEVNMD